MTVREVYEGSDATATKNLYGRLVFCGPLGLIALNLFRAQKCSTRAKVYRGGIPGKGSYRAMAYERKEWSLGLLCTVLEQNARTEKNRFRWGWKEDPAVPFGTKSSYVLYVDLPEIGQVSFHAPQRGAGPDYPGEWDRSHASAERIIHFCESLLLPQTAQLLF